MLHARIMRYMVFALFSMAMFTSAFADCNRGRVLYEQAAKEADPDLKIKLLQQSVAECSDSNAYYELGKAYEAKGQLNHAEQALRDALSGADGESRARVLARLGLVYEKMGKPEEAIFCFKKSYAAYPYTKVLQKLKQLETRKLQQGMSAAQITRSLTSSTMKSLSSNKAIAVEPSVDLHINFEYDSAILDSKGRAQAAQLGIALKDRVFAKDSFLLIGHTDSRGSDEYNQGLSERRAEAVKEFLVQNFNINPGRIRTEGRGERELLYQGNTEQDHALNRRVVVQLRSN